jgi:hypothetical protein
MQFSSLYRVARVLANFVVVAPLPPAAASRTMQCAHSPVVAIPATACKAAAPSVDRRQGSPYTLVRVAPACQTGVVARHRIDRRAAAASFRPSCRRQRSGVEKRALFDAQAAPPIIRRPRARRARGPSPRQHRRESMSTTGGDTVRRLRRLLPLRTLGARLLGIAYGQSGVEQRLREIVAGIDNQSKILSRLANGLDELRELQRAQLVMQRDQVEAIEHLATTIHEPAPEACPAAPEQAANRHSGTDSES